MSWVIPKINWQLGVGGGNIGSGENGGWRSRRFLEETKIIGVSQDISVNQSTKGITIEEGGSIWDVISDNGDFKNVAVGIGGESGGRFDA